MFPLPFKDSTLFTKKHRILLGLCLFILLSDSWGSEPLRGGVSPGKEWELEGSADHTDSITAHITTGSTVSEDHICQARHKRRPHQSQTQTLQQRWGSGRPLAFLVQRILGGWVEFAYLKTAVGGRKLGRGSLGELRGPRSRRNSRYVEWG